MEIVTRDYGVININQELIIRFDEGILGFEMYKNYILLDDSNGESPFRCLQSMEESDLAFILMDPFAVDPEYEITLGEDIVETLMIESSDDVLVLAVVVVPEDIKKTSINLKAPLVFNVKLRKGAQYIVEGEKYKIRHYVMDEIEKMKSSEKADKDAAGNYNAKSDKGAEAEEPVAAESYVK
ncbi:MAG: flagellar assembly protein FliW [Oscillospiraceae bacterium]|nr:flagellar assembly protein FliW [Oscillospiraceae bacterium]